MAQIICIGASSSYGVGGKVGGWPEYLKREIHEDQFSGTGRGERHEVYNFGKPGVTTEFVIDNLGTLVSMYSRPEVPTVLAFNVGGNDSRAYQSPDAFVCTPGAFEAKIRSLLTKAKTHTELVLIIGQNPVNESILNPKKNPWDGSMSYFYNDRRKLFEEITAKVAKDLDVAFVPLHEQAMAAGWLEKLAYIDGLHPNTAGHEWVYGQVRPHMQRLLEKT